MNSRWKSMTRTVGVVFLLGFFIACQDTIPQRSTISQGKSTGDDLVCQEGEELVYVDDASNKIITQEEYEKLSSTEKAKYIEGCRVPPARRPDGAVFWKNDYCACKNAKPVSYGNCTTFCASKSSTDTTEKLYANFTVSEAITQSGLNSVYGWCKANLESDTDNPECKLQAKDENNAIVEIDVEVGLNSNSVTANIENKLAFDKTYILTLVEKSSGAKSNSIQFIKFSTDITLPILGPLKIASINQYTCLVRNFATDDATGDQYFEEAYRLHFYHHPRIPPKAVPLGMAYFVCHDIFNPLYGLQDQEQYPRLETIEGALKFWDETDPRFYDNNENGIIDINDGIISKVKAYGSNVSGTINLFQKRQWYNSDVCLGAIEANGNTSSTSLSQDLPLLGYSLPAWIDSQTYRSYCPTSVHYNSSNALFKALRDFIGVDTEAYYAGAKFQDNSSAVGACLTDIVLLREQDIKKVWFYFKNGVPTVPTEDIIANVAVYFYYPLNKTSPYIKTSTQKLFRVQSAKELNSILSGATTSTDTTSSSGSSSKLPPHDRRLGCIPKL
jgi:hypothetical protein